MENEPKTATLSELAKAGRKLILAAGNDPEQTTVSYRKWLNDVGDWLDAKAPDAGLSAEWSALPIFPHVLDHTYDITEEFIGQVSQRLNWLSTIPVLIANRKKLSEGMPGQPARTRKVFLVHGHDERVRETVARFLEKLRFECVILHEQPNKGRTIIEKFEAFSDVAFAVVLLTPDDRGGPVDVPYDQQKLRARQNVVLELGFFVGKLGRASVCALYTSGVEIPSDYSGVVFIPFDDAGAWKTKVATELAEAGLDLDAGQLLKA